MEEADVNFKLEVKKDQQQGKVAFHAIQRTRWSSSTNKKYHQNILAHNVRQRQNVMQLSYVYWQGDTDRTLVADY